MIETTQPSNEEITCPTCGYYCSGKGGFGCIDKPFFNKPMTTQPWQEEFEQIEKRIEQIRASGYETAWKENGQLVNGNKGSEIKRLRLKFITSVEQRAIQEGYNRGRLKTMEQHGDAVKLATQAERERIIQVIEEIRKEMIRDGRLSVNYLIESLKQRINET